MSRARSLFDRFGTIDEQRFAKPARAMERVNRAGEQIISEGYNQQEDVPNTDGIEEADEGDDEEAPHPVKGHGVGEGHGKEPTYATHYKGLIKFAALTFNGQPFVATVPKLEVTEGIAWVNRRIKGFTDNPKSRESYEEAIRRKALAAHGSDFISEMKSKGGAMVDMELDMMFSKDSHSGIGDLDMLEKKADAVEIHIDRGGDITGLSHAQMSDESGTIWSTAEFGLQ